MRTTITDSVDQFMEKKKDEKQGDRVSNYVRSSRVCQGDLM